VVDRIVAATTAVIDGSPASVFEEVLYARATVAAAGFVRTSSWSHRTMRPRSNCSR
jgi:hypothetical protein